MADTRTDHDSLSPSHLNGIVARAAQAEAEARKRLPLLPCHGIADDGLAAAACDEANAATGCEFRGSATGGSGRFASVGSCPLGRVEKRYLDAMINLSRAGVPPRFSDRVLAALPGGDERTMRELGCFDRLRPPTRIDPTDVVRLAEAFATRRPHDLWLGEFGEDYQVKLSGDEWALVIAGGTGTGKTLAAAWFVANLGAHMNPKWVSAPDLARVRRDRDAEDPVDEAIKARALVIDDVGTEHASDSGWATGQIARVIESRYADGAPTLITTNLDRADFKGRYGERVNDRLNEQGIYIAIAGSSRRGAK